ncbi:TPA: hypothetical protein DCZ15_01710 [Candidatus Falkowbacteria bacterium]|jgi:hypothetical protein|nr:MAG: hypothetical protein UV95_C0004G0005 [Candidatus Falkowbacteria bacterium GW2011_GWF2_43_32]HBA36573.1 hypothetical protein [Candidatus Falkowbacteria bacterium]
MLNIPRDKPRTRPGVLTDNSKTQPRLSLSLHTMPQTADNHFKKWLILGLLVFGLMVIIAILLVW